MIRDANAEKLPVPNDRGKINVLRKIEESSDKIDDEPEPLQNENYIASQAEVMEALDKAFKSDKYLMTKLLDHSRKKLFRLTGKMTIADMDAKDIVSTSIYLILKENARKWKRNKCPNIVKLIMMVIISVIKNQRKKTATKDTPLYDPEDINPDILKSEMKKHKNQVTISQDFYFRNGELSENANYDIENAKTYKENADEIDQDFKEQILEMETILSKDETDKGIIAYCVFQERLDGIKSNIKIAKRLGISVVQVENALKTIKRRFISSKNKVNKIK